MGLVQPCVAPVLSTCELSPWQGRRGALSVCLFAEIEMVIMERSKLAEVAAQGQNTTDEEKSAAASGSGPDGALWSR